MNSDVLTAEIDDTITMDDTNNITTISSPVIELSLTEELEKQVTEPTSDGRPENMVKDTNDMLHMVQESTLQDAEKRVSFATVVVTENTHKKVNFRKVEEDVASNVDYESMIPMSSVVKVNERLSNTIYGYFIGKRVAFPVVENYMYNAWGKFGIQKVMMYAKGFYFFKFSSTKGVDDVLENGPWMIRQVPIILNTWSPSTSLTKENHSSVPIWVKMHDVPMAAFTDDGLSFIASKTRNPLMLDSYTSTMCNESWGRSSYARAMIEVHANVELKESILVAVPKLEGNGYTCETVTGEYEWKPPRCSTCKIFGHMLDQCPHTVKEIMPIKKVEREMDGFQLVKDRNAGRKTTDKSYGVKTKKNLVYRPVSKANQVIRYIKGTKEHGIIYKKEGGCKITGYSDSSYGINTDQGKGTTGIVFYFGESPITWCTQKQPTVALSSCESEFMAATGAACQALWLKRLLSELTGWEEERITLKVDNISAIALVKNPVFHGRSKHIDIRYHFIRECVENGHINVEHVSGELQRADILTKALPRLKFVTMRQMLGVQDLGRSNDQD
ncbi:ribonuclease H-like domain, reverse transcriptase, RNA-dependent DNA polymerase [Tanacetum coccineum]